jgi:hypothetical protein
MTSVRRKGSIPRSAALVVLGALAVHQLRYLLAYGSGAHQELALQGHGYLLHALPVLIGFGVAILAAGLLRAALRAMPNPAIAAPRLRAALYAASIVSVFAVQESAEGLLSAGHAAGIGAVFGAGGWLALPLAALFGALCAALDGGLARLEARVAGAAPRSPRPRAPRRTGAALPRASSPLASLPLAFGLARRPPPLPA